MKQPLGRDPFLLLPCAYITVPHHHFNNDYSRSTDAGGGVNDGRNCDLCFGGESKRRMNSIRADIDLRGP